MPSKYIMGKQGLIGSRRGSEASHIQELLTSSDVHATEYHWICWVILEDEPANLICVRLRIDHPVHDEMEGTGQDHVSLAVLYFRSYDKARGVFSISILTVRMPWLAVLGLPGLSEPVATLDHSL